MKHYRPEQFRLKVTSQVNNEQVFVSCPYHATRGGRTAIFSLTTGSFHCFSCGAHRNVFELAREQGVAKPKRSTPSVYKTNYDPKAWEVLLRNPIDRDNAYLKKRGLTPETIERFQIASTEKNIFMPTGFYSNQQWTGVVIRNLGKYGYSKYIKLGDIPVFAGLDMCKTSEPVFVVENTFAFYLGWQQGYQTVSPFGTNIYLDNADKIRSFPEVYVWANNDTAGYRMAGTMYGIHPKVKIIRYGDPDDLTDWSEHIKDIISHEEAYEYDPDFYKHANKARYRIQKAKSYAKNKQFKR